MTVLAAVLIVAGAAFVAVAALGLVRLPDFYLRLHAVSKAGAMGCGLVLSSAFLAMPETGVALRVAGAVLFLVVTTPVASHLLGRAAHRTGSPQCASTVVDEWIEEPDEDGGPRD